jgi:hypothetical protein
MRWAARITGFQVMGTLMGAQLLLFYRAAAMAAEARTVELHPHSPTSGASESTLRLVSGYSTPLT